MASREVTKIVSSSIVETIKNSDHFVNMVQFYIDHNLFSRKNERKSSSMSAIATNKDTNSRTEDQKEEETSSSEVDNEDNLIITSKDV